LRRHTGSRDPGYGPAGRVGHPFRVRGKLRPEGILGREADSGATARQAAEPPHASGDKELADDAR